MDVSSLLSGLLGALIGVATSLIIYLADRNRREQAAVRAVFYEAITNELALERLATKGQSIGPISNALYLAHMSTVTAKLTHGEMRILGAAYLFIPYCEQVRLNLVAGHGMTGAAASVVANTHNSFLDATSMMRKHAYGKSRVDVGAEQRG